MSARWTVDAGYPTNPPAGTRGEDAARRGLIPAAYAGYLAGLLLAAVLMYVLTASGVLS